jgi:hypothetical protein
MSGTRDPLAHLRTTPRAAETAHPAEPTPGVYAAFDTKDKLLRLKIRRANGITRAPAYTTLLDVVHDGAYGKVCYLVFTFVWFKITGKNLQPLFLALESHTAEFIQEYGASVWPGKLEENQTVVEKIEVVQNQQHATAEIDMLGNEPA